MLEKSLSILNFHFAFFESFIVSLTQREIRLVLGSTNKILDFGGKCPVISVVVGEGVGGTDGNVEDVGVDSELAKLIVD